MYVRDLNRFSDLWWGPWAELDRLQGAVGRALFGGAEPSVGNGAEARALSGGFPPVNVWTQENGAVITAAVAGVGAGDFEIDVVGRDLTITVDRPLPEGEKGQALRRNEIFHGRFARAVTLPFEPDAEKVEAHYRDGVLSLHVPRSERDRPRKIEVTSAH